MIATIQKSRVVPLNRSGVTTRRGRIGRDEVVFAVRPETFGERLRRLRQAAGLSQTKLAELSGVSQPTISAAELGHWATSGAYTVDALARALGIGMTELWRGETS